MNEIKGLGTALITPFKNGQVDFENLERLIEEQIAGGVDYVVTMGTTGESVTLTPDEVHEVVRFTVDKVNQRVPIVVGIGGNDTQAVAAKIQNFDLSGITAILSASPAYNKPSQEGIYQHYMALDAASDLPIIVYNVPGRTSSNISPATLMRIAADGKNIIGVKEASGDIVQGAEIIRQKSDDFVVLSGDDPTALGLMSLGAEGCISVISNAWPAEWQGVIQNARRQRWDEAKSWHLATLPLHHWLYIDGNPAGIKAALHIKGKIQNELRLPLVPMAELNYQALKNAMDEFNRSKPV